LSQGRVVAATTKVGGSLGLAIEVGLDGHLTRGILGGDAKEFPHCAQGLVPERVDEHLTSCAVG
jgi:hypothetical protein